LVLITRTQTDSDARKSVHMNLQIFLRNYNPARQMEMTIRTHNG